MQSYGNPNREISLPGNSTLTLLCGGAAVSASLQRLYAAAQSGAPPWQALQQHQA
jgi:hypothetical protein